MILVAVDGAGHQLDGPAAASYARMCTEHGSPLPIVSAWRSTAQQAALYAGWVKRLPGFNLAARPGTSTHELGDTVDYGAPAYLWLERNAAAHGWARDTPTERWHYRHHPDHDTHTHAPPTEDDDMTHIDTISDAAAQAIAAKVFGYTLSPRGSMPAAPFEVHVLDTGINAAAAAAAAALAGPGPVDAALLAEALANELGDDLAAEVVDALVARLARSASL